MWVRIKGILYNLSLVKSIDFNRGQFHTDTGEAIRDPELELMYCASYSRSMGNMTENNESIIISFDSLEDAQTAYSHIIKTIDIPQLDQEDFHN